MENKKTTWLEYCKSCKRNHIVTLKVCPDCGVHMTPQPVSEKVYEKCRANYRCNGCDVYLEHLI